jgi:hypothetical protein
MRTKVFIATALAALAALVPVAPAGSTTPPAGASTVCTPAWGNFVPPICV